MEKDIVLTAGTNGRGYANVMRYIKSKVYAPVDILRRYYSAVLEKEVTMKQTWLAIEAQIAFFASVLPNDMNICIRLLLITWFFLALKRCSKSGL